MESKGLVPINPEEVKKTSVANGEYNEFFYSIGLSCQFEEDDVRVIDTYIATKAGDANGDNFVVQLAKQTALGLYMSEIFIRNHPTSKWYSGEDDDFPFRSRIWVETNDKSVLMNISPSTIITNLVTNARSADVSGRLADWYNRISMRVIQSPSKERESSLLKVQRCIYENGSGLSAIMELTNHVRAAFPDFSFDNYEAYSNSSYDMLSRSALADEEILKIINRLETIIQMEREKKETSIYFNNFLNLLYNIEDEVFHVVTQNMASSDAALLNANIDVLSQLTFEVDEIKIKLGNTKNKIRAALK